MNKKHQVLVLIIIILLIFLILNIDLEKLFFKKPSVKPLPSLVFWSYRREITINNPHSSTLTDFQINITLNTTQLISQGKMRSDCGDIRFTDSDGSTQLSYWIESGCNSDNTKIWVKVPSIPAGSKKIYVYYGNPSANSTSNGDTTFVLFDDFNDGVLDTNKWQPYSCGSGSVSEEKGYLRLVRGGSGL
ncbi:MAG: DUF2341 domain-containing protein, partial [Candidatus Aenigmarchaeota archaeon]|nr:DUF2341 domain-containing protein [Candidatus Aenigmarchaeota archaeon]